MSRIRLTLLSSMAVFAVGAIATTVAQAARPVQPVYTTQKEGVANAPLVTPLKVENTSVGTTRIWISAGALDVTCSSGVISKGEFETKGRAKGEMAFKECHPFEAFENGAKQIEEGEAFTACVVQNVSGGVAGEIKMPGLKSRLVWAKGKNEILVLYTPETGTLFADIELKGAACALKGKYTIEGSALAEARQTNEEAVASTPLFEVKNGAGAVAPLYTEFEVEEGTSKETGSASLISPHGHAVAIEGAGQAERVVEGTGVTRGRGLLGIHE
jgi:hypothetical protein